MMLLQVTGCGAVLPQVQHQHIDSNSKSAPAGYTFQCTSVGTFPDPYDCTGYHVCYQDDTVIMDDYQECDHGWIYNPLLKTCSIDGTSCATYPPVPTCTEKYQVGSLSKNPNTYYI
ncbi:hypothetical protein PR048_002159 [Dryococelus australis]|uniref:Chitin-binding type-2 domain-containing protein n=1 Tax=Dryococelus australis TaxID=614101 RepID=A0ABQ9ILX5_9NEOP|nr:hypothetical protein PR048_002159 [Dryococelus australis]